MKRVMGKGTIKANSGYWSMVFDDDVHRGVNIRFISISMDRCFGSLDLDREQRAKMILEDLLAKRIDSEMCSIFGL